MFGFGTEITFTFETQSITVSRLNNEFILGAGGEGYLDLLGIDRVERKISLPQPEDLALGNVILKRPAYGLKFQYVIRLGQLTKAKYDGIQDFITGQHQTGTLIRLDDKILKLTDYGAQSRAIALGTSAPIAKNGFLTYYPSLRVWVPEIVRKLYEGDGRGQLEFEAIEYGAPISP